MRTFRQLRESSAKVAVITFGRFNPPTIGHEKMIDRIMAVAKRNGGDAFVFASASQDAKKNPFPYDEKIKLMKKMFPVKGFNIFKYSGKKVPTVMHAASELYKDGYEELIMVVGSDRVRQFQKLLPDYNGVEGKPHGFYDFGKISIESAGERDPDADGAEGMSASKMRQYAVDGDYESFSAGMPASVSERDKRTAFSSLRKHMRIRVIEKLLRKDEKVEPITEKNQKVVEFDQLIEYLYNLPYQATEKIYIDKTSEHLEQLIKEENYYTAKHHVNKIKNYILQLDEMSGMVDFTYCDLKMFDDYLDHYERPVCELKPLNERLQKTVKEGEFETALAGLAGAAATKLVYDKLIKPKLSIKAKIKQIDDKIESLRDRKRDIEEPKKRERLADEIAKLEDEKSRLGLKVKSLNKEIEAAKKKRADGTKKSKVEVDTDKTDAAASKLTDLASDEKTKLKDLQKQISKLQDMKNRTDDQEKMLNDLIKKKGTLMQKLRKFVQSKTKKKIDIKSKEN